MPKHQFPLRPTWPLLVTGFLVAACTACVAGRPQTLADCPRACPAIYAPVCLSDGSTSPNECTYKAAVCNTGLEATIVAREECPKDDKPAVAAAGVRAPPANSLSMPPNPFGGGVKAPSLSSSSSTAGHDAHNQQGGGGQGQPPPTVVLVDQSKDAVRGNVGSATTGGSVDRPAPPPYAGDVPTVVITDGFVSEPKIKQ